VHQNWQWDGYVNAPRPRTREAASLSIKVGEDSTIRYLMPMVADAQGYHPHLNVHLNNVTVSSSLNDTRLLTTKSCEVSLFMPAVSVAYPNPPSDFGRDAVPSQMGCQPPVDIYRLTQSTYILSSARSHQYVY
jgi:hypothetical protein